MTKSHNKGKREPKAKKRLSNILIMASSAINDLLIENRNGLKDIKVEVLGKQIKCSAIIAELTGKMMRTIRRGLNRIAHLYGLVSGNIELGEKNQMQILFSK